MTINELKIKLNNLGGNLSGIYLIKDKATGEPYVGKALEITKRILEHINNKKAKSGIDKKLAEKGIDAFEFEILDLLPGADNNLLFFKEQEWIAKLDAKNSGNNLTQGNTKHTKKWLATLNKYLASHTVSAEMLKLIARRDPQFFAHKRYTLVHEYDDNFKNRLKFDDAEICQIQSIFVTQDAKGELKENNKELANYINKELDNMKLSARTDLGVSINNVPYGDDGARIMKRLATEFNYEACYSLEPGNDYFTKDKLYQYIDPTFRPIICRNGCFKDASQTTVIAKLQKTPNKLTEVEARILLHLDVPEAGLYNALSEYILKVGAHDPIRFTQLTNTPYDKDKFLFNPGAFDIHHGYFAVYDGRKKDYTSSTKYNLLGQDATGHANMPGSIIKGANNFKKIIYSEDGLRFLRVLFGSLPEGWGFVKGIFAGLDYNGLNTVTDMFNALAISSEGQVELLKAMARIQLTDDELQVVKLAKETL